MFRALHVLLTISALLLCPFNCMGTIAVRGGDGEAVKACPCCHPQSLPCENGDSQESQSPSTPEDECSCTSCLCRGAILPDDHLPLDMADVLLELPPADALAPALAPAGMFRAAAGSFPPYALQSGRLIRFALQSLQV